MSENSSEEKRDTALVFAAADGDARKVAELLSQGGRVDAREHGFTPLQVVAQRGHTEVCKLLIEKGSDLEESSTRTQDTALHKAAINGHEILLQLLLSHNAEVNSRNRIEDTPLHLASQEGHLASVVTLLQAGADPLLPDDDGFLPIHLAANHNHDAVVRILIEEGGCSPDQVRHTYCYQLMIIVQTLSIIIS